MSHSHIPEQVADCKGVILPYHPGFVYAALESSEGHAVIVLGSKPDFLQMEILDVSNRKVMIK